MVAVLTTYLASNGPTQPSSSNTKIRGPILYTDSGRRRKTADRPPLLSHSTTSIRACEHTKYTGAGTCSGRGWHLVFPVPSFLVTEIVEKGCIASMPGYLKHNTYTRRENTYLAFIHMIQPRYSFLGFDKNAVALCFRETTPRDKEQSGSARNLLLHAVYESFLPIAVTGHHKVIRTHHIHTTKISHDFYLEGPFEEKK